MDDNLTVVIFGGTGSIGTVLTEGLIKNTSSKIILVSNNEHELWTSKNKFKEWDYIEYVFCDIRDKEELEKIFMKFYPDIVINCAALKHLNYCEEFPINTIKTNILGLENLLHISTYIGTGSFIQISTDKACEPSSVMGASKLIGERLCLQWNKFANVKISIVRLGNVLGSRGSLIPQIKRDMEMLGKIFITDAKMERFFITKKEVWKFIKRVIDEMKGGEIFVPKLESKKILEVIEPILHESVLAIKRIFVGKGKYEKLKEKLFSEYENVKELDWCYKIE
jgi:FlaA1/EpsC-like NDP-sugar epimerase